MHILSIYIYVPMVYTRLYIYIYTWMKHICMYIYIYISYTPHHYKPCKLYHESHTTAAFPGAARDRGEEFLGSATRPAASGAGRSHNGCVQVISRWFLEITVHIFNEFSVLNMVLNFEYLTIISSEFSDVHKMHLEIHWQFTGKFALWSTFTLENHNFCSWEESL